MTLPSDDKSSSSLPPSNSSSRGTGILIGCLVMLGIALLAFTGLVMTNTNTIQQTQGAGTISMTKGNDSISFKTTLEPPFYAVITQLNIPQKSNFTFSSGNPLCPTNNCKQEVIGGFYDISRSLSPHIQGTLKIENKTTSTPDIIRYSMIPFIGDFQITGTEENRKMSHIVMIFNGDFGLGDTDNMPALISPEFKYNVTGSFDNSTKTLTFK
jgi:hypothetical protein